MKKCACPMPPITREFSRNVVFIHDEIIDENNFHSFTQVRNYPDNQCMGTDNRCMDTDNRCMDTDNNVLYSRCTTCVSGYGMQCVVDAATWIQTARCC